MLKRFFFVLIPVCLFVLPAAELRASNCVVALHSLVVARLQGLSKCPKCGKAVQKTWKFCDKCGTRLTPPISNGNLTPAPGLGPFADHPKLAVGTAPALVPESQTLTSGADALRGLAVSRDGATIVFGSNRKETTDLYVLQVKDGSVAESQLTSQGAAEFDPDISPDGSKIVYVSEGVAGDPALKTMPVGGGEPTTILTMKGYLWQPRWSPDGTRVAFVRKETERGPGDIFVLTIATQKLEAIAVTAGDESCPAWCPKGCHLAYEAQVGAVGLPHIHAKPVKVGASAIQVTKGASACRKPAWSPKHRIIYESDTFGSVDLFSIDESGGDRRRLTDSTSNETNARVSANGVWLVFLQRTPLGLEIARIENPF